MDSYSFGRANEKKLEENFIKALKNPNFVKVANSLDISDKVKMKYTLHLLSVSSQLEICQKCKGLENCPYDIKGLVEYPVVENDYIKFVYRKCKYREKHDKDLFYLKNIKYYKMSDELLKASFKNIYKDDSNRLETVKALKEFYDDYIHGKECKGIYLYGNFGCGKSYLVSALFNELAKSGIKSCSVYFPELLRSLKASFGSEINEYEDRFDEIKEAKLLLLDDVGAEKVTEWSRDEVLGTILQYRMDNNLPTFITSNLSIKELEENLSIANGTCDKLKSRRIVERIKYLCNEIKMISVNRRKQHRS